MRASAFDDSAEWLLGRAAESAVRAWYVRDGWFVVPLYAIEDGGAPKLMGQLRSHVLPDLQVARAGVMRWVEVKAKTCPVLYQKLKEYRHGVDLPHWNDYLRVEDETGLPGYLAIVQIKAGRDEPPAPMLLLAPFALLRRWVQIRPDPTESAPRGMAYFDADLFERFEGITNDVATMPPLTPKIVHPWERGQRLGPRQLRLDTQGW